MRDWLYKRPVTTTILVPGNERTQGADAQLQLTEYPSRNPAPPPET